MSSIAYTWSSVKYSRRETQGVTKPANTITIPTLSQLNGPTVNQTANIDQKEVDKFSDLAQDWWNPNGSSAPLHQINPCRLAFVQQHAELSNKLILDVGCGAGILTESLAKHGAVATGIDASPDVISVAQQHAKDANLTIEYTNTIIENFSHTQLFDVITCMELLEHIPEPSKLILDCANLLKPGGKLFISTINRTLKAYSLAIVGAEYLLKILPKQTHDYQKFIRPHELAEMCRAAKLNINTFTGINYNPLTKSANLSDDITINYLAYITKEN